jgi:hypothetical protein
VSDIRTDNSRVIYALEIKLAEEKSLADELAAALEECLDDSRSELADLIAKGMDVYRPYLVENQKVQVEKAESALRKYKEIRRK